MKNQTIYKSFKIKNNILELNKIKLYLYSSDINTEYSVEADIVATKRQLTPFIKTAIKHVQSIKINHISPTYIQVTLLYTPDAMVPSRGFKTTISIDLSRGLLISF